MKKILFKTWSVLMVCILSIMTANAQNTATSVSVYPTNPTLKDSISIVFTYVSNDGCPDYYLVKDSVFNDKIYVVKKNLESDRVCTQVISKFATKINLGTIVRNTQIYFDGVLIKTIIPQCTPDKSGIVVKGSNACAGQLFIQEVSPLALIQLYSFENNVINSDATTTSSLKAGDKVKFGGFLIRSDSLASKCNIVGRANCWVKLTDSVTCVKDRKGVVSQLTEKSSIIKDIATGEVFEISGEKLSINTIVLFKGAIIQCITAPCYNIVECYQIISVPPTPCVMEKKGVVVAGKDIFTGRLFIKEISPINSYIPLYAIQGMDATTSTRLKVGDEVKFGGYLQKNDSASSAIYPYKLVGVATCWEVISDTVACIMDRKGVVNQLTENSSIVKDITTGEIFAINGVKLAINTIVQFKGVKIECFTTPCYNIVECYQVVSVPPTPCVMDKRGVVVNGADACANQLFIMVPSTISAYKILYAIKGIDASNSTQLKVGDEVKFGGYSVKSDSTSSVSCRIVGVATCWEVIKDTVACIMDRKGVVNQLTEKSSIVKDITTGEIFAINGVKLAINTIVQFKGVKIECITTPCYNIVECYQVVSGPPTPCEMDKSGVVVEGIDGCTGQLFIEALSPAAIALKQLYTFKNNSITADGSVSNTLKVGDKVKFGGYLIKNDSNTVRLCNIIGVATCWEVTSTDTVTCVMDRKGIVTSITKNSSIVTDRSTGEIFAIQDVELTIGTVILFKGVTIQCFTTPCYNIVECYQVISIPPTPCVMDKTGVVVPGIDGCTGRLFIQEKSETSTYSQLYEIQNFIVTSSDGTTKSKLQAGDKVKFGGYLTKNDSTKSILCYTAGVATCWELIASENTYTLAGKVIAGNDLMKSGLAVLFRKGEGKAVASNTISDGTFTFKNIPEAAYTVYVIPDINIYKNYMPTFYINKFLYNQADYIKLNKDKIDVVVYLTNFDLPIGTGRIFGNIYFETVQLKDSILAANGVENASANPNRTAENTTVVLFDNSNQPIAWTITDASGNYLFENLAMNTYRVVSETASAKAEVTINLSTSNTDANADLILKSPQEKTGLNQVENNVLDFYPNPVADKLIINVKQNEQVNIYSAVGQLLLNQSLNSGINILDVSSINKGIYFAKIGNTTIKLIKK